MRKTIWSIFDLIRKYFNPTRNEYIINRAVKNAVNEKDLDIVYATGKQQPHIENATIRTDNLYYLRYVLVELSKMKRFVSLTPVEINSILNHENAHANMAEIVGAIHLGYMVTIVKEDKKFCVAPFANFDYPDEWLSDKERIKDLIRILNAPNEYGDRNSVSDNKRIKKLQESLLAIH